MLNQTTRYVLGILSYLARRGPDRVPAHQIAADTKTPANYVAKILGTLHKQGVVEAEKGWGGGFTLRVPIGSLSLGELLDYFGESAEPSACPFVEPQCGCPMARRHESRVPLSDLVVQPRGPSADTAGGGNGGDATVCPYGAPECVVALPCPLHAHWAKVREGFWGLAATPVSELIGRFAR
jgi:Rrf2 family protein